MSLLEEIITSVTGAKEPVSDILRRCLVLAYRLKNDRLKSWVEKELNGYGDADDLPDYRTATGVAKGLFLGPMGAQINNQPLAPHVLDKKHRHHAVEIRLVQPIASYEGVTSDTSAAFMWPADLVALYQSKFIQGYALNRAWMEIPASLMIGLVDQVRTRILTFALEITDQLPETNASVEKIPPAEVQRIVNIAIFGGNNHLGDAAQINAHTVLVGDLASLVKALDAVGLGKRDLTQLQDAILVDKMTEGQDPATVGQATMEWIKSAASKVGKTGLKIGATVAEEAIKRAVLGYLGI